MEEQNEDDINVDMTEIKKVLEDANIFEPNMTKGLMISYYRALRNSENTASEENQTRKLNESQEELKRLLDKNVENIEITPIQSKEKPFTPKIWSSEKKPSIEGALERNNNENTMQDNILEAIISDLPKDATKVTFGFNEMVKDSGHTLSIITHELKFIPIQNSNKFLNAGISLKAKMLYAYHTKVNKMKTELARLSFYPAPLPRVITATETFLTFPDKDTLETYVCRSGRQTKRKIYKDEDDDDSMDGISNKKVKNSEKDEWLKKPAQNKNSTRIQKKQETNKINSEVNKTDSEIQDTSKEKKTFTKKETRTPVSKNMSNTEIMARSSIFNDTPKWRSEIMFEKLKEAGEKKEREEKNMELFTQTLEKLDDEDDGSIPSEEIINVVDEEPIRRRVTPPKPARKIVNRKRSNLDGLAPLDIKVTTPTPKKEGTAEQNGPSQGKEEQVSRTYLKKRPPIRRKLDTADSSPSTSRTSKATIVTSNVICPICDGSFEESKIEEHAATCGDDPGSRSSSKISRITCEICNKVVDFDTSYEVHVKECISKKSEKD